MSSPILFSIYIDDLYCALRSSGLGCRLKNVFYGCFGNADDLLLLSASRSGLQSMVNTCSQFMNKKSLKFSTNVNPVKSKTKCIIFSKKIKDRTNVTPVRLNGDALPWVDEVKHQGNILENDNSMKRDIAIKRGKFIGKVNSLLQEFHYVSPTMFMTLLNIYAVSFHGSGLWDLYSSACDRLYKSWNVTVRSTWKVPNTTHRYLIEDISGSLHLKVMLSSRYAGFVRSLLDSPKYGVRVMASWCLGDRRTVLGQTMSNVAAECGVSRSGSSLPTPAIVKKHLKYFDVPNQETWRTGPLGELLNSDLKVPGFDDDELGDIISFLCSS